MANKSFKITLSAVYNNDKIVPEIISDQIWEAMKNIGNGLVMLDVDSIKEIKDSKKVIKKVIEEAKKNNIESKENECIIKKEKKIIKKEIEKKEDKTIKKKVKKGKK